MSAILTTGFNQNPPVLVASPGVFSFMGAPSVMTAPTNIVIPASTGSFSVSGKAATLSSVTAGTPAFSQNFDGLAVGSQSGVNLNWGLCTVDNTRSFSGANSYKCHAVNGSGSFGCSEVLAAGTSKPTQGDEVWFRIRTFFALGFDFTATPHLKFLRIDTGSPAAAGHGAHIDIYISSADNIASGYFDFILEGVANWLFGGGGTTPVPTGLVRGQWQTWEVYYKLHSVAANAAIRLWRDGTLIVDTTANIPAGVGQRATLNNATDVVGNADSANPAGFMFVTYWNTHSPATQDAWVDDFTIYCSNIGGPPGGRDAAGNVFIGL